MKAEECTGAYIWTSAREDIMKVVDWIPITDPVALPLYIRIRAVMLYGGHSPYPYHTQGTRVRYYDWVQQLISDSCLTIVFSPSSTSRVFDGPGCAVKRKLVVVNLLILKPVQLWFVEYWRVNIFDIFLTNLVRESVRGKISETGNPTYWKLYTWCMANPTNTWRHHK